MSNEKSKSKESNELTCPFKKISKRPGYWICKVFHSNLEFKEDELIEKYLVYCMTFCSIRDK